MSPAAAQRTRACFSVGVSHTSQIKFTLQVDTIQSKSASLLTAQGHSNWYCKRPSLGGGRDLRRYKEFTQ